MTGPDPEDAVLQTPPGRSTKEARATLWLQKHCLHGGDWDVTIEMLAVCSSGLEVVQVVPTSQI